MLYGGGPGGGGGAYMLFNFLFYFNSNVFSCFWLIVTPGVGVVVRGGGGFLCGIARGAPDVSRSRQLDSGSEII